MKKPTVAIAFAVFSVTSLAAGPFDVSGVPLGISQADGKSAVQAVNAKYALNEIKTRDGMSVGWQGTAPKAQRSHGIYSDGDYFLVLTDDASRTAWYVGRLQSFLKQDRLSYEKLLKALKEKYGQPTSLEGMNPLTWEFDRSGKQYHGVSTSQCPRSSRAGIPGVPYAFQVPTAFSARCGMRIEAHIERDSEGLVKEFYVEITDDKIKFDEADAIATREAAGHQRERETAKATNKPKL